MSNDADTLEQKLIDANVPKFMSSMCNDKLKMFIRRQYAVHVLSFVSAWVMSLVRRQMSSFLGIVQLIIVLFFIIGLLTFALVSAVMYLRYNPNSRLFLIILSVTIATIIALHVLVYNVRIHLLGLKEEDGYMQGVYSMAQANSLIETFKDDTGLLGYNSFMNAIDDATPQDCVSSPGDDFGPCSQTCGGGVQVKEPKIITPPTRGGKPCLPPEIRPCNVDVPCPIDCEVDTGKPWVEWSSCSAECGGGTQTRAANVKTLPAHGGKSCPPDEVRPCNLGECKTNCQYSWGEWQACDRPCGGGNQKRFPTILVPPTGEGKACPEPQSRPCNSQPCPVDCKYTWGPWGECDATTGTKRRQPIVTVKSESGGAACPDPEIQACPVDCVFSWNDWTACDGDCDTGVQSRSALIERPNRNGGTACPVPETRKCDTGKKCCDYEITPAKFTRCSQICRGGTFTKIKKGVAAVPGVNCPDVMNENIRCNEQQCPSIPPIQEGLTAYYSCETLDRGGNNDFFRNLVQDIPDFDARVVSGPRLRVNVSYATRPIVIGAQDTKLTFPEGLLKNNYTLFHVTKYEADGSKRILTALPPENWISGFDNGNAGVAYHGQWITPATNDVVNGGKSGLLLSTDQRNLYRGNGWTYSITNVTGTVSAKTLAINPMQDESSAFCFACLLVYDRELSLDEIELLESWIQRQYGYTAVQLAHSTVQRPNSNNQFVQVMEPGQFLRNKQFLAEFTKNRELKVTNEQGEVLWSSGTNSGHIVTNSLGDLLIVSETGVVSWVAGPKSTNQYDALYLRPNGLLSWGNTVFSTVNYRLSNQVKKDEVLLTSHQSPPDVIVSVNKKFACRVSDTGNLVIENITLQYPVLLWSTNLEPRRTIKSGRFELKSLSSGKIALYDNLVDENRWTSQYSLESPVGVKISNEADLLLINKNGKSLLLESPPFKDIPSIKLIPYQPNTTDIKRPPIDAGLVWYFTADTYDSGNKVWKNAIDGGGDAVLLQNSSTPLRSSIESSGESVLVGDRKCIFRMPSTMNVKDDKYTLFYLARHNGVRGKILSGYDVNWLSGFDVTGSGVAYHGNWITPVKDVHFYDWIQGTDQIDTFRTNRVDRTFTNMKKSLDLVFPKQLMINDENNGGDWMISCVMLYNRKLTPQEIYVMEQFLWKEYHEPILSNRRDNLSASASSPSPSVHVQTGIKHTGRQPPIEQLPWAYFIAESYQADNGIWYDVSGNSRHAEVMSRYSIPSLITGEPGNRACVSGTPSCSIRLAKRLKNAGVDMTIFHVARYAGATRNRIITNKDTVVDWYSGFSQGKSGVAKHAVEVCMDVNRHDDAWVISCDQIDMYRSNGKVWPTPDGVDLEMFAGPGSELFVNGIERFGSDFQIACVLMYDSKLSTKEITAVESYLVSEYDINFAISNLGSKVFRIFDSISQKNIVFSNDGQRLQLSNDPTLTIASFQLEAPKPDILAVACQNQKHLLKCVNNQQYVYIDTSKKELLMKPVVNAHPGFIWGFLPSASDSTVICNAVNSYLNFDDSLVNSGTYDKLQLPNRFMKRWMLIPYMQSNLFNTYLTRPPVEFGLVAWYDASSYAVSDLKWQNKVTNSGVGPAILTSPLTLVKRNNDTLAVYGLPNNTLKFPRDMLASSNTYTLFHIAKYAGPNKNNIFVSSDPSQNWASGFVRGLAGVSMQGGKWITQNEKSMYADDQWVVSTDQPYKYRSNGYDRTDVTLIDNSNNVKVDIVLPVELSVNTLNNFESDFEIICVMAYTRCLSEDEIVLVEHWLSNYYRIPITKTLILLDTNKHVLSSNHSYLCRMLNGELLVCPKNNQNITIWSSSFGLTAANQLTVLMSADNIEINTINNKTHRSSIKSIVKKGVTFVEPLYIRVANDASVFIEDSEGTIIHNFVRPGLPPVFSAFTYHNNTANLIAYYTPSSFDMQHRIWKNVVSDNYHAILATSSSLPLVRGGGSSSSSQDSVMYLKGDDKCSVLFPGDILKKWNTLIHVARYGGGKRNSIFTNTATGENEWVSGFSNGTCGVAKNGVWLTQPTGVPDTGDWMISVHTMGYSYQYYTHQYDTQYNMYYASSPSPSKSNNDITSSESALSTRIWANGGFRMNGVNLRLTDDTVVLQDGPKTFGINVLNGHESDWEIAAVMIYDHELPLQEIRMIERWLMHRFSTKVIIPSVRMIDSDLFFVRSKNSVQFWVTARYITILRIDGESTPINLRQIVIMDDDGKVIPSEAIKPSIYPIFTWNGSTVTYGAHNLLLPNTGVAQTDSNRNAFVRLDLGKNVRISRVIVKNRIDCCQDRILGTAITLDKMDEKSGKIINVFSEVFRAINDEYLFDTSYKTPNTVIIGNQVTLKRMDHNEQHINVAGLWLFDIYNKLITKDITPSLSPQYDIVTNYGPQFLMPNTSGVAHTQASTSAYVQLQLPYDIAISRIEVVNRKDCCLDRIIGTAVQVIRTDGTISYRGPIITTSSQTYKFEQQSAKQRTKRVVLYRVDGISKSIGARKIDLYNEEGERITTGLTAQSWPPNKNSIYSSDNIILESPHLTVTEENDRAYVAVDIDVDTTLSAIVLYNRSDCCQSNLIGTSIAAVSRSGDVIFEKTITDAEPEYKFHLVPSISLDIKPSTNVKY